ncbi:hypothetical protein [Sphingomonas radiodurans]|uniref:hypothetical protein n=1 Tax=Sphingomonas radiodurans TaxID=2890321 RepID=UPI001E5AFD5E|nr:hypothetical protein [Sphingomonas radiodurans]WBH17038.1 hypothetical protein LLW23_02650 [Sphingomonas radiodurans]
MSIKDSWPAFVLMAFAVASGQIGRLGQRYERGQAVGRKKVIVELTMLPAFGALGGALAAEYSWPIWTILGAGIAAGWTGFGTFRLVVAAARFAGQQMAGMKIDPPAS